MPKDPRYVIESVGYRIFDTQRKRYLKGQYKSKFQAEQAVKIENDTRNYLDALDRADAKTVRDRRIDR